MKTTPVDLNVTETALMAFFAWQEQVEKVYQKQASMQEMFDKRKISLKKLAAKQTRPVQPVAPRPEAFIKSPLSSPGEPSHCIGVDSLSVTSLSSAELTISFL